MHCWSRWVTSSFFLSALTRAGNAGPGVGLASLHLHVSLEVGREIYLEGLLLSIESLLLSKG